MKAGITSHDFWSDDAIFWHIGIYSYKILLRFHTVKYWAFIEKTFKNQNITKGQPQQMSS